MEISWHNHDLLQQYVIDKELIILPGYDHCIMGIEEKTGNVIYSAHSIIATIVSSGEVSLIEALEHYNSVIKKMDNIIFCDNFNLI